MSNEHVQDHIDLIARHEMEFAERRTRWGRVGDAVASFAGSMRFVGLHVLIFAAWILGNTLQETARWRFDPYPFPMLDTVVALEAILLASFILMRQQRISRRADERDHLMLQVLLLTEKETTALLQVNRLMAAKLGLQDVARDKDLTALSQETSIDAIAENIQESLPVEE